jgi:hypothetical protein
MESYITAIYIPKLGTNQSANRNPDGNSFFCSIMGSYKSPYRDTINDTNIISFCCTLKSTN